MSLPSFKVNSKPEISQEEFNLNKKGTGTGGKFLQEPGTYDMVIKEVSFKDVPDDKDSAWINSTILLDHNGKTLKYFLSVPTECRNGFLYGAEKVTWPLEKVQKFFRGLGLSFDFDNGMSQVAALFGNPDKLIGKTIKVRLGYNGPHVKYVDQNTRIVVDKDHVTQKIDGTFPTDDAAVAGAALAGLKLNKNAGFINVQEIFPSKEALVDLDAAVEEQPDLPF